ncbi:MAG: hypothetical protein U0T83_08755 [Bacteriovoracaceae bacterium]
MPNLNSHILNQLLLAADNAEATHFEGFEFPLLLKNSNHTNECLENLLRGPSQQCSIKNLLQTLVVKKITNNYSQYFINTNYPSEWNSFISGATNET